MLEVKDPVIKLFGTSISLPPNEAALDHYQQSSCITSQDNKSNAPQSTSGEELIRTRLEDDPIHLTDEESIEATTLSGVSETAEAQGTGTGSLSPNITNKEEQSETSASQDKTLKKPDKILPCPRCNSLDTKFCYYNNYNVNQPRHFCKKCQRYWTAGGTIRNVPVGSGRRKNKNSCAFKYQHIMVSDALSGAEGETASGIHLCPLKADDGVLQFVSERPLCESKASSINLVEGPQKCVPNGLHSAEPRMAVSIQENCKGFTPQVTCHSGTPWPSAGRPRPFSPSGFPITSYRATPYWGCTIASPWDVPWLSPLPTSPNYPGLSINSTLPTLGKHSRDECVMKSSNLGKEEPVEEKGAKKSISLPKTLRIDNLNGAAKSSIWSTVEIKNDKKESISTASLFKAFQPKVDEKHHVADTFIILQANPAAFSRSVNFHEST